MKPTSPYSKYLFQCCDVAPVRRNIGICGLQITGNKKSDTRVLELPKG